MSPMNFAQSEAATSTLPASLVARVRVSATTVSARRGRSDSGLRRQVDDDQDDRGPEDDDEQRREDATDEREQHLDRRLRRLLLRALPSLDAKLLRLDLEDLRDRHAELLGLDD